MIKEKMKKREKIFRWWILNIKVYILIIYKKKKKIKKGYLSFFRRLYH